MNKQETIPDIIAEKRRRAEKIERDCAEKMKRGEMISDRYARELVADIRREADRLEAAHKRDSEDAERRGNHAAMKAICETIEKVGPLYDAEFVGDAAKLREAAKTAQIFIRSCGVESVSPLPGCGLSASDVISEIDAALAAPQRNCDRFKDALDAWDAYDAWVDSYRSQGKTEPFNEFGWLFAPATEQEGGAK